MTLDEIQSELTRIVTELEAAGADYAAAYVAQAKLDLRRAQALLEPGEPMQRRDDDERASMFRAV